MYDAKTVKKRPGTQYRTLCWTLPVHRPSSAVLEVGSTSCLQVTGCHYSDTLRIVSGSGRDHICDLSNAGLLC
jgi:hypothetical protein